MAGLGREIWLRSVDLPFHRSFRLFGHPVIAPFHIAFAVTYRCLNLCHTCQSFKKSQLHELTLKEYSRIFDGMKFSPFCVTFTGGEPFLKPEFNRIAALACGKLKPPLVIIETCGDHPNRIKRIVSTLAGYYSDTEFVVWISLDGVKGQLDSMRGGVPRSFETALQTYTFLKQTAAPNLIVGFNILLSKYNTVNGAQLVDDVFMLYPDIVSLDVAHGSDALGVVAVDVAPDRSEAAPIVDLYIERLRKLRGGGAVRFLKKLLERRAETALESLGRTDRVSRCFAGHAYLYVDPAGSVRDCPVAAREMGDFRENNYSLERILKAATARRVRELISSNECACTMSAPALCNTFMSPAGYITLAGAVL